MKEFIVTPDIYASKGQRFVNLLIDVVVFYIFFFMLSFIFGIILMIVGVDPELFYYQLESINPILDRIITSVLLALYYFLIETVFKGKTIGKFASNTRLVTIDGEVPSTINILKRSFSRIIPFDALSFLGSEGRGWHDTIPNLYVVDVKKFEEKKMIQSGLDELGTGERDEITGVKFR
ncbi:RDD family protein [Spongiivirga sp. MCCC 1A20706]|uniref:RDD family protein n=1 Tax=Spongiivirga sp. MCCC 1A20706 TaxID=3160963 RepID=UPI003977A590